MVMAQPHFRVGITPDFYVEAKGKFESEVRQVLGNVPGIAVEAMPEQPGNVAILKDIDQYDAIFALATKFTAESVTGAKRLTVVARWGVGYDMIDVPAFTQSGVALAITPAAVRRPVAEAILSLLFALTTNLLIQDRIVRQGKWRGQLPALGRNLKGRTLGSLGCGNIASELFQMSASLGFGRLLAHDPFVTEAQAAALGVELVSIEKLFSQSDFVSIYVPLSAETKGVVNESLLRLMKPQAFLINTARGPIVDEAALIRILEEGVIAGAGLDVFEVEPLPADNKLRLLDNVILAPHGLAWTEELARDNSLEACRNILAVYQGQAPGPVINREVLAQAGFQQKLETYRRAL